MSAAYVYGGIDRAPSAWQKGIELSAQHGNTSEMQGGSSNYPSAKSTSRGGGEYAYGGIDRMSIDWACPESPSDSDAT